MRFNFWLISMLAAIRLAATNPQKTILICGTVTTPTHTEVELFLLNDPLHIAERKYVFPLLNAATFSCEIPLEEYALAEIKYGEIAQQLWLEPGQSLELQFSGTKFIETLQFLGSGAPANLFLLKFQQRFALLPQQIEQFMATATAEHYQKYIFELSEQRRQFIENDPDFARAGAPFQIFFTKNEIYWAGYQLLRYAFDKPLFEGRWEPLVLPKSYYQFLEKMHISTGGILQSTDYQAFLDSFIEYQKIEPENNGLLSIEVARKKLSNEALWLFESREIFKTFKSGKPAIARQQLAEFKKICTLDLLIAPLEQLMSTTSLPPVGTTAPNFGLTAADGKMWSLSDLHGKIVLLDFWATWCQPCLDALPNMKELQARLPADRTAILYISLDKNPAVWQHFINRRELSGIHLWGESMQHSEIARMYGVAALPAYILIDQRGKIAFASSGSVSPEAIYQHIQQLLNFQH